MNRIGCINGDAKPPRIRFAGAFLWADGTVMPRFAFVLTAIPCWGRPRAAERAPTTGIPRPHFSPPEQARMQPGTFCPDQRWAPSAPASYASAVRLYMARPMACVSTWTVPTTWPMARAAAQAAGSSRLQSRRYAQRARPFLPRASLFLPAPRRGPPARPRADARRPAAAPQRRPARGRAVDGPGRKRPVVCFSMSARRAADRRCLL